MEDENLRALYGGPMSKAQFRKLYPATRNFQHYDHNARADRAASHRLGHRQREAPGEFFYTHLLCPGVCFPTHGQAIDSAYPIYLAQFDDKGVTNESETRLEPEHAMRLLQESN